VFQEIWFCIGHIASGLADMHNVNLVHRDMKPENVFVTESGRLKIGSPFSFRLSLLLPVSLCLPSSLCQGILDWRSVRLVPRRFCDCLQGQVSM
jgi:serine/threonine protein kinase